MAFTQSRHDFCLRSCSSVKRRRWGQRSAITATFFGEVVNHLPTVVALPIRSFVLADTISLFCFRQPAKATSRAPDLSALPSPGGDRMVDPAASLSLPQPLSNPLPLLPRLPYYPPILTTPSPTNPLPLTPQPDIEPPLLPPFTPSREQSREKNSLLLAQKHAMNPQRTKG